MYGLVMKTAGGIGASFMDLKILEFWLLWHPSLASSVKEAQF